MSGYLNEAVLSQSPITTTIIGGEMDKSRQIFFVKAKEYVGALIYTDKTKTYSYAPKEQFVEFAKSMLEEFPNYKARCVIDDDMTEFIEKKIDLEKKQNFYLLTNRER